MKLDPRALGLALGGLAAVALFVATLWVMAIGGGDHLEMLKRFFLGYSISAQGAVIGALWAFVAGFVGGWVVASLYTRLARG